MSVWMGCKHGHLDHQQCIGFQQGTREERERILDIIEWFDMDNTIRDKLIDTIEDDESTDTCSRCWRTIHALGFCQAHYKADLRRRHLEGNAVRAYNQKHGLDLTVEQFIDSFRSN